MGWVTEYHYLLIAAQTASVDFISATDTPVLVNSQTPINPLAVELTPLITDAIVPGSVKFTWAGNTYYDREGSLYRAVSNLTNSGTLAGTIDYSSGKATLTQWAAGSNTLAVSSLLTLNGTVTAYWISFRTPGSPLYPGSLMVRATTATGASISGTADMNGVISGTEMEGSIDVESGVAHVVFGKWVLDASLTAEEKLEWWYVAPVAPATTVWRPTPVIPSTIKFDCVMYSFLPLDADILGVDTVRLPQDGRVAIYKPGNVLVIHDTQTTTLPNPLSAGQVVDLGRVRLAYAHVFDANGLKVLTEKYSANLDAGTMTFATPLDLTAYAQPLKCEHRIEDMALCSDVQITGQLSIVAPLSHAYTAGSALVSSALIIGDLQARYTNLFEQASWTSVWSDTLIGAAPTSSYNDTTYPLEVTDAATIQERWAIIFTSSSAFRCVGETVGQVAIGDIMTDFSPINPNTSTPYFTIRANGWGSGWATGNLIRFNTAAANYPVWMARTTLQGAPTAFTDNFRLQIRGDAN